MNRVDPSFFKLSTVCLARQLLGKVLKRTFQDGSIAEVRICETEAYHQDGDQASHSFKGQTDRNGPMFGPPGRLYVYMIYGIHHCFNVVSEAEGIGAAVLIRAATPLKGLNGLMARRGGRRQRLLDGPGKLAQALDIDRSLQGIALDRPPLQVLEGDLQPDEQIIETTRIGISKSIELNWRFVIGHKS